MILVLSKSFNPCYDGIASQTWGVLAFLMPPPPVSILIVVEWPLKPP